MKLLPAATVVTLAGIEREERRGVWVVHPWSAVKLGVREVRVPGAGGSLQKVSLPTSLSAILLALYARWLRREGWGEHGQSFDVGRREEIGVCVLWLVFAAGLAGFGRIAQQSVPFWWFAGACVCIALVWLWAGLRKNARELVCTRDGVIVVRRSGDQVVGTWEEISARQSWGTIKIMFPGFGTVRFRSDAMVRAALIAGGALRWERRRGVDGVLRRAVVTWVAGGCILSAAGTGVWWWLGLQQVTGLSAWGAMLRMLGAVGSMLCLFLLQVWGAWWLELRMFRVGVRLLPRVRQAAVSTGLAPVEQGQCESAR